MEGDGVVECGRAETRGRSRYGMSLMRITQERRDRKKREGEVKREREEGGGRRKRGRDRKGHDVCRNAVSVSILRTNVAFGH